LKIEFSEVRLIPIASVLAQYQIPVRRRSNTELVCDCPLPSHKESQHQKQTFAIGLEKNRWYCHSDTCRAAGNHPKGGDVIDLVSRLDHTTPLDAAKKLAEIFRTGIPVNRNEAPAKNTPLAFQLKGIEYHPYIQSKGISEETAKLYGVGYFPGKGSMANRIVFPLYEDGSLVGYAGRVVDEPDVEHPKWLIPRGLVKSFLYGLEKCEPNKILIISESFWAPLWFRQKSWNCASLMGKEITAQQERRLEPYRDIVIAMDNDEPGRAAASKIYERLRAKHKVFKSYLKE
jgi:DNA primase